MSQKHHRAQKRQCELGAVVKLTQFHFQRFENVPRNVLEWEKRELLLN